MNLSAVVLAGGSGSRMGCDKALLHFGGRPLIERTVETLRGLFGEIMIVGREPGSFPSAGADAVLPDDTFDDTFIDDVGDAGPLGGIATGLRHMKSGRGFFVACDMPLLDGRVIAALVEESGAVEADAIVPVHDGRPEPLHAVYAKTCLPAVEEQIESGELRIQALFEKVRTHYWDVAAAGLDARCFSNVNTKADLEALEGARG